MSITGAIWYQGESYVGSDNYDCRIQAMISDWRASFATPFYFGFVQISTWIVASAADGVLIAIERQQQLAALNQPRVGMATAVDLGDALSPYNVIHPRAKQPVGTRLLMSALTIVYGRTGIAWQAPTVATTTGSANGNTLSVSVSFVAGTAPGGLMSVPGVHCPTELGVPVSNCDWFAIGASDGNWYNATTTIAGPGSATLVLTATVPTPGLKAVASRFGWNAWPVVTVARSDGLPVLPWNTNVTSWRE